MSKKEKVAFALAEDFQAVIAVVPRLEALIKAQKEIAAGYQKYRKNGGDSISGIEKYFGINASIKPVEKKAKSTATATEVKMPKESTSTKKVNNKVKK